MWDMSWTLIGTGYTIAYKISPCIYIPPYLCRGFESLLGDMRSTYLKGTVYVTKWTE